MLKKSNKLFAVGIALTASLTLAACSNTGSAGGNATPSADASASSTPAAAPHNEADVMFAQMMMPHHSQAVDMSEMLLSKEGISEEVTTLATDISAAQGPEIEQLSMMLEEWGEDQEAAMDHSMNGMMSEEEMSALEGASGTEAERLFLEQMIAHHTGAIEMAQTEVEDGENPDALAMAENIVSSQQSEIDLMEDLLASR
jgi:uncharacterized protein (DUF305 family)